MACPRSDVFESDVEERGQATLPYLLFFFSSLIGLSKYRSALPITFHASRITHHVSRIKILLSWRCYR